MRLTFSASPDIESNTATLETVHEEEEYANFLRYTETTKINSNLFDHTGNDDTHYAIRLNGSANERIGLARSLAVMTGDTVRAEVYAKYLDPNRSNWTAALQNLIAAIAAGTAPPGTVVDGIPLPGDSGFPFSGLLDAGKAGDTGPQAYLNYLVPPNSPRLQRGLMRTAILSLFDITKLSFHNDGRHHKNRSLCQVPRP